MQIENDNSIYYDSHMDYGGPDDDGSGNGSSRWSRILKTALRTLIIVSILAVFLFILYRIFSSKPPASVSRYLWSENSIAALEASRTGEAGSAAYPASLYNVIDEQLGFYTLSSVADGTELTVKRSEYAANEYRVYEQYLRSYTENIGDTDKTQTVVRSDYFIEKSDYDGCYYTSDKYFIPAASEVQLTFRWNARYGIERLMNTYALSERPAGEFFVFSLTDDKGNEYTDYKYISASRSIYRYRRMLFSGIDFDGIRTLTLNVYFAGNVSSAEPYISMVIYDANLPLGIAKTKLAPSGADTLTDAPVYSKPTF